MIVYGAAGFVSTTLLLDGEPPADDLVLVDPAEIDPAVPARLRERGAKVTVRRENSLDTCSEADVLLVIAGQTDVDEALANPALAFVSNPAIALNAAQWSRRHPSARAIYLSTDEVLGVPQGGPLAEDAPLRPTQPYAASKAMAETTLRCYRDTYGTNLTVIRSCNLVGARQRARKLIPIAVQRLAEGRPVPVLGTGRQTREYLSVDDLCDALRMAVAGSMPTGWYHCSSEVSFTVLDVIELVAEALGVAAQTESAPDRLVQDRAYAMDASLLRKYGWRPRRPPAESIGTAARALYAAWSSGEDLRSRRISRGG
ncbi:NAD-dependent epimerase/dehydratase family protein [Micromonospora coerulea]|uniref:NAD-dependent epimerase/dehydratase family protein n=1 Tax=Micromonospora coerulea TaxID=47856 RepID=UPI001F43A997|nr:NAD-dependent epimerase/dehydratase family protein [Micromonospora veneta]